MNKSNEDKQEQENLKKENKQLFDHVVKEKAKQQIKNEILFDMIYPEIINAKKDNRSLRPVFDNPSDLLSFKRFLREKAGIDSIGHYGFAYKSMYILEIPCNEKQLFCTL